MINIQIFNRKCSGIDEEYKLLVSIVASANLPGDNAYQEQLSVESSIAHV